MNSFLKQINNEQSKILKVFELKNIDLEGYVIQKFLKNYKPDTNSFSRLKHSMKVDEGFCEPDLNNLIEYEKELNGRH